MGWWKADLKTGQISNEKPSNHKDGDFLNAIPGRDKEKDIYNGDEPADVMGDALVKISKAYKKSWKRPAKKEELIACFNFCLNGMFR